MSVDILQLARYRAPLAAALLSLLAACGSRPRAATTTTHDAERQLPTGVRIEPAGTSTGLGSMPLAIALAPDGKHAAVLLGGWREQGLQIVETTTGRVTQTLPQRAAFIGLAFAPDGRSLYTSGGDGDIVYRYAWDGARAQLADSLLLSTQPRRSHGTRYPAGLALSPDGRTLYVAENLADSVAVIDVASRRVRQHLHAGHYPYGVAVAPNGAVYVSAWGGNSVYSFTPQNDGLLNPGPVLAAGRHPSALLLNPSGSRLFAASGSTDRITVIDTRTGATVRTLSDTPPSGPGEGSTPNALALSKDGARLFVVEADNNALAVFDLAPATAGATGSTSGAAGDTAAADRLVGRVPVGWYPTGVAVTDRQILIINGKGEGTGPNPDGPSPSKPRTPGMRSYTLGQTTGTFTRLPLTDLAAGPLAAHTALVAQLNDWGATRTASRYPPFTHVIYVIKENRTYDQVFGDLPEGDGDTTLLFFPERVSPNHHALAERFGDFDRFFCNAEVSPDGHNWSTAAYVSDYGEKTIPSNYSNRGRTYDYEGTNGGYAMKNIPDDDVNEPGNGYLWNLAERAGITFRNYGEFVTTDRVREPDGHVETRYIGNKPFLKTHTNEAYPGFNLDIEDQARIRVWLDEFARYVRTDSLPALEIVRLPNDHTSGANAGKRTPWAYMADNDDALGQMVQALSASQFWKNTVVFVVEDDAQNGPDHVDSHRAPFLVISAYNHPGVYHRWTNTTDVIATITDILHLGHLSQFDAFGRPLKDVFAATPDTTPYVARPETINLEDRNPAGTREARQSAQLDFSAEDRADENLFNHVLWSTIKGRTVPYPGVTHAMPIELQRSR